MATATLHRPVPLPEPSPERWPSWPLLAVRCTVGADVLHGVLVDGGGFNVYLASIQEALGLDENAAELGLTWAQALERRFRVIRYPGAEALLRDGWVVDASN